MLGTSGEFVKIKIFLVIKNFPVSDSGTFHLKTKFFKKILLLATFSYDMQNYFSRTDDFFGTA